MRRELLIILLVSVISSCPGDKHCKVCEYDQLSNKCLMCQYTALDVENNKCIPLITEIPNCIAYNTKDNSKCQECELGYTINEGACKECPEDCAICDSDGLCRACYNGKKAKLDFNCKGELDDCKDENCEICGTLTCHKCKLGFSLIGESDCVKGVNNCLLLEESDKCRDCDFGYYVDNNYKCTKIGEEPSGKWGTFGIVLFLIFCGLLAWAAYYLYQKRRMRVRENLFNDYVSV